MTCNNANVPDGLLIGVSVTVVVALALWGEAFFFSWLIVNRRASLGWVVIPALAVVVGILCTWLIADIWNLRVALQHGSAGGKGVCMVFWNQQLYTALYAISAIVLAAVMGGRALWGTYHRIARE